MREVYGNIVDLEHNEIFSGVVYVENSKITRIERRGTEDKSLSYILPGFIDAHVHIESTMVTPLYFANHVKKFGTIGVIADPHEISNVCGVDGFDYMYNEAKSAPIKIFYGIPSCVPATPFETSGADFSASVIDDLFKKYEVVSLSEMMNFPGVIYRNSDVLDKLNVAKKYHKKIDGHAPGLKGADLLAYVQAGITTDHEAFTYEEGKEKILAGMKIQIREGSAARNFEALHPLIDEFPDMIMFCTDDAHPDTLMQGHIDRIVRMAVKQGHNIFNVLRAASLNAINHYDLPIGNLTENAPADFIVVNNLETFEILETVIGGETIYLKSSKNVDIHNNSIVNNFIVESVSCDRFKIKDQKCRVRIIKAMDGELITDQIIDVIPSLNGFLIPDLNKDYLKLAVINRYKNDSDLAVGFIHGFNLKNGAIAGSVAHDSHNIICLGTSDEAMAIAVNAVVSAQGGIVFFDGTNTQVVPLPVGGLMANESVEEMAVKYELLDGKVKSAGCPLGAPFMTLAFMSLLVIPSLKLGDRGLFDVNKFEFVDLFES